MLATRGRRLVASLWLILLMATHLGCSRESQSTEGGDRSTNSSLFRNLGKR
jgi:hypothetical protein